MIKGPLAGIFSALAHPLYRRFVKRFRGRRSLASFTTLLLIVILILIPLGGLVGIITAQAIKVGQSVTPWVQKQIAEPDTKEHGSVLSGAGEQCGKSLVDLFMGAHEPSASAQDDEKGRQGEGNHH